MRPAVRVPSASASSATPRRRRPPRGVIARSACSCWSASSRACSWPASRSRSRRRSGSAPAPRPTSYETLPRELEHAAAAAAHPHPGRRRRRLATLYDENRVNVPLCQIAPIMRKAIVAIEDYRFYQHGALDLKGTLRALVTNQASGGVARAARRSPSRWSRTTLLEQAQRPKEREAATADTYARKLKRAALRDRLRAEATPRTGSSSATSTSPTSATAPTASRRPSRHYFDKHAARPDPAPRRRCSPGW